MNNDVTIKVGDYEVFSNGTVIVPESEKLLFEFNGLKIQIAFETRPNEEPKVSSSAEQGQCLNITLINFDNSLGIGLTSPVKIGYVNGKDLYLLFIVHSVGEKGAKMCSYTWLTKKKGE